MKKIGCVIAFTENHNNYGTSLQGYATIVAIKSLGYTPEVIRYKKQLALFDKLDLIIKMLKCGGVYDKLRVVKEKFNLKLHNNYAVGIAKRTISVNNYKNAKLIPYFKEYVGYTALHEGSKNYGAVLVGSDQVWTPMSLYSKYYNLLFVEDSVPKLAYASSFGVSVIPDFQVAETARYLNRFDKIGVREIKGKELVESISTNKAQVVADPTMLLSRAEWEKEIADSRIKDETPYIFCYFLGTNPEARMAAIQLSKDTGYKIIAIRHMDEYVPSDEQFGDEAPYDVDPNDFVKYISKAEYVLTDSFHCSVFSTIFHRQFMTFYRFKKGTNSRNSRIDSLFAVLGINKEHIYSGDISRINTNIDWNNIDANLSNLREESKRFLKEELELAK